METIGKYCNYLGKNMAFYVILWLSITIYTLI